MKNKKIKFRIILLIIFFFINASFVIYYFGFYKKSYSEIKNNNWSGYDYIQTKNKYDTVNNYYNNLSWDTNNLENNKETSATKEIDETQKENYLGIETIRETEKTQIINDIFEY